MDASLSDRTINVINYIGRNNKLTQDNNVDYDNYLILNSYRK